MDGINYGGIWLMGKKGAPEPSAGHAIDHIGFRPIDVDAAVTALKAENVKVLTEPRPLTLPSGTTMRPGLERMGRWFESSRPGKF